MAIAENSQSAPIAREVFIIFSPQVHEAKKVVQE